MLLRFLRERCGREGYVAARTFEDAGPIRSMLAIVASGLVVSPLYAMAAGLSGLWQRWHDGPSRRLVAFTRWLERRAHRLYGVLDRILGMKRGDRQRYRDEWESDTRTLAAKDKQGGGDDHLS